MVTDSKSVLITGASSGMGRACALRLAREGYRVFACVRKEQDADRLAAENLSGLHPVILDVTQPETIEHTFAVVRESVGELGLSALINNAGVGITGPVELLPIPSLRRAFEVNLIGQVEVIQTFLPLIRIGKGRIVNVGSVGGSVAVPYGSPICATKSAFESLTDSLRIELRPWGIPVILIAPGSIHTPAVEKMTGETDSVVDRFPEEGRNRYEKSYRNFIAAFARMEQEGVGPEVMAETVVRALASKSPKRRYPVGPKSRLLPALAKIIPGGAMDAVRAKLFGLA